jgi:hypothetical protein
MLREGKTPKEIQDILSKRAGSNLSGAPESALGWALPVGLLGGALLVLFAVFRRIKKADEKVSQGKGGKAKGDKAKARKAKAGDPQAEGSDSEMTDHEALLEERLRRELDEAP